MPGPARRRLRTLPSMPPCRLLYADRCRCRCRRACMRNSWYQHAPAECRAPSRAQNDPPCLRLVRFHVKLATSLTKKSATLSTSRLDLVAETNCISHGGTTTGDHVVCRRYACRVTLGCACCACYQPAGRAAVAVARVSDSQHVGCTNHTSRARVGPDRPSPGPNDPFLKSALCTARYPITDDTKTYLAVAPSSARRAVDLDQADIWCPRN